MEPNAKSEWDAYVASEKARVEPFLKKYGFILDAKQPQTIGERYLTRPIGGGRKVVFFGKNINTGQRVVIKTSNESRGIEELKLERRSREMLHRINFAYRVFSSPEELFFDEAHGILITEFIEQDRAFLERPLKEQFAIALEALKAQEGAHATAAAHWALLEKTMLNHHYYVTAGEYRKIGAYAQDIVAILKLHTESDAELSVALDRTIKLIREHEETLERYSDFLTHWDFIPQNFRIRDGKLYLLDHSSIRFGNKYEGWARFINFMTLYNPPLAEALVAYVRLNRAPEELLCLKLMRLYRLVELLRYYATWLGKTEGNLRTLTLARIAFWTEALTAVLDDAPLDLATVLQYKEQRYSLRSEDEKKRQQGLH
jgi:hypothetical protein